eukprot:gene19348-biopygen16042
MNYVIFGRPAWPPQPPRPRAPGCQLNRQQSSDFVKTSLGGAKRFKRSRQTLVGKRSAGALHRLFRRFERARSGVRTAETSENPGSKNPDFPLKTAHRLTEDKPAQRTPPPPRREFASRVRALPPRSNYE